MPQTMWIRTYKFRGVPKTCQLSQHGRAAASEIFGPVKYIWHQTCSCRCDPRTLPVEPRENPSLSANQQPNRGLFNNSSLKNDWTSENCLANILPRSQPTEGQISRASAVSRRFFAHTQFKRTRDTRCGSAVVRPPGALWEGFKLLIGVSRSR